MNDAEHDPTLVAKLSPGGKYTNTAASAATPTDEVDHF
jgi:hypothetical protein